MIVRARKIIDHPIKEYIGRIVIIWSKENPEGRWYHIAATPTQPTIYNEGWGNVIYANEEHAEQYNYRNGPYIYEEVDLATMKWIHPHLLKEVREDMERRIVKHIDEEALELFRQGKMIKEQ